MQAERSTPGCFDYIEDLIERENTFTIECFAASVGEFLAFRKYDNILKEKRFLQTLTGRYKMPERGGHADD